tara:strand:+ start:455 stop:715 length:261 start_codon:yes stop_codon:yes gene_type:complete
MSRPSNPVILTEDDDNYVIDILEVPGTWILLHDNKSIGIRQTYYTRRGATVKYPRIGFNNPAHAYKLADKMNKRFNTTLFTIAQIG